MLLSGMRSEVRRGADEVKLMILEAKKAQLHAKAEWDLFVQLPAEAGGGCARLVRGAGV